MVSSPLVAIRTVDVTASGLNSACGGLFSWLQNNQVSDESHSLGGRSASANPLSPLESVPMSSTTISDSDNTISPVACPVHGVCDHMLAIGNSINPVANVVLRASLVVILAWIGAMKFTTYEAEGIRPFIENSPFFGWTLRSVDMRTLSDTLGLIEIIVATMIAARPVSRYTAAVGGFFAATMFVTTLSFLITTPGTWVDDLGGAPAISVLGQFLIKDLGLLGIALWSIGEALTPARSAKG